MRRCLVVHGGTTLKSKLSRECHAEHWGQRAVQLVTKQKLPVLGLGMSAPSLRASSRVVLGLPLWTPDCGGPQSERGLLRHQRPSFLSRRQLNTD